MLIRNVQIMVLIAASVICISLGGCVTSAITQVAAMPGNASHKPDHAVSAYTLPDGNLVIFVKGRLRGVKGESEFSLLVPRAELDKVKEKRHGNDWDWYTAPIGPSADYRLDGWIALPIERSSIKLSPHTYKNFSAAHSPVLYEVPNENGYDKVWGNIELLYVEENSDGTPYRIQIFPEVTLVKGNAGKWLPLTIPADIATLPIQALWAALFFSAQVPAK